jgi:hypothetical protein
MTFISVSSASSTGNYASPFAKIDEHKMERAR